MLVLTRKLNESIMIDDTIKITILQIKGKQIRIGIEAPSDTKVYREELYTAIQQQNTQALRHNTTSYDLTEALILSTLPKEPIA